METHKNILYGQLSHDWFGSRTKGEFEKFWGGDDTDLDIGGVDRLDCGLSPPWAEEVGAGMRLGMPDFKTQQLEYYAYRPIKGLGIEPKILSPYDQLVSQLSLSSSMHSGAYFNPYHSRVDPRVFFEQLAGINDPLTPNSSQALKQHTPEPPLFTDVGY
jgi:hypothetical protein